jgi:hypothetical protein
MTASSLVRVARENSTRSGLRISTALKVVTISVWYFSGITAFVRNLREAEQAFVVFGWRDRVEYTIPAEAVARERLRCQATAAPRGVAGEGSAA